MILPAGFGSVSVTTAEKHDEIIAFTSQLAHVVFKRLYQKPYGGKAQGFSAGAIRT
jgi:prephenate dehydrogenase